MSTLRKWWKPLVAMVLLLAALQAAVSFLAHTRRVHSYLAAHLERAFGRPVEVASFNAQLLPSLQLDANGITVGEDPAFGHEYFLRAERLTARLRWSGLLRGHFEFGNMSLNRPSLILVRNAEGRWNLERWLPPAKGNSAQEVHFNGPPAPVAPVNHLERIDFDEGRINFKVVDDKLAFAFTNVSGNVNQIALGRWQLQLEAQPWRSGVLLQSAGTIRVVGDVAGTSTRLQPAQVSLHWTEASLADVFRLFRGQDYGLRGVFALDVTARSGVAKEDTSGDWKFSVMGRAAQIHRWDLTERSDNARLNVRVNGRWNIGTGDLNAEEITIEGPRSNLRGMLSLASGTASSLEFRLDSMGVQASDLLAWYRSFHPYVAQGVTAEQYFTGGMILRGWPLVMESAALSSSGGIVRVPGLVEPVRIGPVSGGCERGTLTIGPVRVSLLSETRDAAAAKRRRSPPTANSADLTLLEDQNTHAGSLSVEGNINKVEDFLKIASSFGHQLNHGWELSGQATALTKWEWKEPFHGQWNGRVGFKNADLTVAGLNQPLKVFESALDWAEGRRSARVTRVEGFGGTWTGDIEEASPADGDNGPRWKFHLSADELDAADLDRWVGPRSRPNWLQRLLPTLLGSSSAPSTPASELVRRVNAEGELDIGELTIEKLKLKDVVAKGSLHDLQLEVRESHADWAGGKVRAKIDAKFLPRPVYDIAAEVDRVNLAQLPGAGRIGERLGGVASGTLQVKTEGVGRDELLKKLVGRGDFHLNKVEFRGWDVSASVADGTAHTGVSRWPTGEGSLHLRDSSIVLDNFRLDGTKELTFVNGTLSFGRNADIAIETTTPRKGKDHKLDDSEAGHVLKISGPLDGPKVSVEKISVRQPAD